MAKCEKQIDSYIGDLLSGKARKTGKNSYLLGIAQRAPYRLFQKSRSSKVGVDKNLCIKCGQCAKYCPSHNINIIEFPEFLGQCSQCMRCYSYCPVSAVTFGGKPRNTAKHGAPYRIRDKRFSLTLLKRNS